MSPAARLVVTAEDEHAFRVEIEDSGSRTSHRVEVPSGLADELGWGDRREEALVEASFAFLLEREPPSSILRHFSLEVIGRYFPEYSGEMRRLAGRGPAVSE